MDTFEFEVGKQYQNRRGTYTVLELHPPKMHVRYDDGVTADLTIEQQLNIARNIYMEAKARQIQEAIPPKPEPKARRTPKAPAAPKVATPKVATPKAPAAPKARAASSTEAFMPQRVLLANDPEDQNFKANDIRIFTQFKGYGNPVASIWFLGMEEHTDLGTVELKHRLAMDLYGEPYVELPARLRAESLPVSYRYATPEWRVMAFIGLRFNGSGRYPEAPELDEYFSTKFGTASGNVLLSDVLPLPAPAGTAAWPYSEIKVSDNSMLQYHLRDRKLYTQMFLPERISLFQHLYEQHIQNKQAPEYIFCYGGRRNWTHYRKMFPFSYVEVLLETKPGGQEVAVSLGRDNESGTWVILTGNLSDTRGEITNHLCDQLAQRLEKFEK